MGDRAAYMREYRRRRGKDLAEKQRGYQADYEKSDEGKAVRRKRRTERSALAHRFVGVDGEGYTDENGVHHYMCLIAGDAVLYTGEPLTSEQCLDFLSSLPVEPGLFYVGFFFDYDVTMILRGMVQSRPDKGAELVNVKPRDEEERIFWSPRRFGSMVPWRGFGIDYVPKKHLSVARYTGEKKNGKSVRSPAVTVHDVRAFFQCAFVKALDDFSVGTQEQRDFIRGMKAERADFDVRDAEKIIEYSKMECALLGEMVGKLRDAFVAGGLSPAPYEGPGPVAGRVLASHVTGKERMDAIRAAVPPAVWEMAAKAYYGGRFEVAAHGSVKRPVWEYDIKSAYPDAMRSLPCLVHGQWSEGGSDGLYVAELSWTMPEARHFPRGAHGVMGPLPVRAGDGSISFPTAGSGWYWSPEIPPYAVIHHAWSYQRVCDCSPFDWVDDLYQQRADLERQKKGSGIGLKLTLNSLYGKLAQRIGKAPHYNPVWASLITAYTRAKIYSVYLQHPRRVVMMATDAVFLTEEAPELTIGSALGEWEIGNDGQPFQDFCIFQPGVYFDGETAKFKTRGVPKARFAEKAAEFREAANDFGLTVRLDISNHLGVKLGLSYGEKWHERIGNWIPQTKEMKAAPEKKRASVGLVTDGGVRWSLPIAGDVDTWTNPYVIGNDEIVFEDQLDWEDGLADGPE